MRPAQIMIILWSMTLLTIIPTSARALTGDTYFPEEIIKASWGTQNGEFGLIRESEDIAPTAMAVDEEGNIYIIDGANTRVQKFSPQGDFITKFEIDITPSDIALDDRGNFYLLDMYNNFVYQYDSYDSGGTFLRRYSISPQIEFIKGLRISEETVIVSNTDQQEYRIGRIDEVFEYDKQLLSVQKGLGYKHRRYQIIVNNDNSGQLTVMDTKTSTHFEIKIETTEFLGAIEFLNTDFQGNIYILKEILTQNNSYLFEIEKYDAQGKFITRVRIPNNNITYCHRPVTVDEEGYIYFMKIADEGFSIIRWEERAVILEK